MFVTESLLAFTIFRDEFDVPFLLMFGFLLFVKCFHWLMADRVESVSLFCLISSTLLMSLKMDQTPYPGPPTLFHVRINALFGVLWAIDITMFAFAVESTLTNGVGGMVLFASEVSVITCVIPIALSNSTVCHSTRERLERHAALRAIYSGPTQSTHARW